MANFTQQELKKIQETFDNIKTRMDMDTYSSLSPNDKPIAEGYAMMARLLKDRLTNDSTLTEAERATISHVMAWFQGAEKVNRSEGAFSIMIRTYSDKQGELRYGSGFSVEQMQKASNRIGLNAFIELERQILSNQPVPLLDMQFIADKDAIGVGEVLFNRDANDTAYYENGNSAWSGVSLFSVLGSDQTGRILGSGAENAFDTLTDLRDSMFLLESFRHAFSETVKYSLTKSSTIAAMNTQFGAGEIAAQLIEGIAEEMGLFVTPKLKESIKEELKNYQSGDFELVGTNALQATADVLLLAMTQGNFAYNTIKSLVYFGNHNVLDALQGYYQDSVTPADYDNFVGIAHQLFNSVPDQDKENKVQWLPQSASAIQTQALLNTEVGLATRYALLNLDPIVFTGFDFSKHNQNGELNLYGGNNLNGMTKTYIQKRTEMLNYLLARDTQAANANYSYTDLASGQHIGSSYIDYGAGNNGVRRPKPQVIFGSDDGKTIQAGGRADFLFGGTRDDTLNGGEGNDYLEGGSGNDIYLIEGEDIVLDVDMQGKIIFSNVNLQATTFVKDKASLGTWYSTQTEKGSDVPSLRAIHSDKDLIITHINGDDSVVIKDFFVNAKENGSGGLIALGVELDVATKVVQPPVRQVLGAVNRYNLIYASVPLYTQVTGGDLDDLLFGNGASGIHAELGGGNDRVFGSYFADYIDGGADNDILNGSQFIPASSNRSQEELALDTDTIIGGSGRDLINGMAGNDTIHTGLKNEHLLDADSNERGDWALGGQGNDSIFGSTERDLLMGGADSDTIHGGAGDDVILGDGGIRFGTRSLNQSGTPPDAEVRYNRLGLGQWQPTVTQIPGTAVAVEHTVRTDEANPKIGALYAFQSTHPDNDRWTLEINHETGDYVLTSTVPLNENDHRVAVGGARDYLYGGSGNDLIVGQDGSDYLYGGVGNDILYGDDNREDIENYGNDFLNGGEGSDRLYGGRGYDTYWFSSKDLQNPGDVDVIYDSDGEGRIVIDGTRLDEYDWIAVAGAEGVATQWQTPTAGLQHVGLQLRLTGSDLELTAKKFAAKILIQNFNAGNLDLNLPATFGEQEEPLPPEEPDTPVVPNDPATPEEPAIPEEPIVSEEPTTPEEPIVPDQPATPQIANKAPVATGLFATQKLTAGEEWWYALPDNRFSDPDGDRLAYSVSLADGSPLPDWLRFDRTDLTLTGTPAAVTELQLKVSVSDGRGGSADSPLQLNIVPAGRYQRPDRTLSGTDLGETLHGSDSREDLNGYGGNDVIYGYGGNDVINGGAGNDYLEGGDGADTYVFSEEWGQDTVVAVNGEDHMYFKDTVLSQVSFSREGADLLMNKKGTSDQIRMVNQFGSASGNEAFGIVNWEFADGQILKAADVYAITEMGNAATQTNNLVNAMAAFGNHAAASDSGIVPADNRANILLTATAA